MSLGHSFGTDNCRAPEHLAREVMGKPADVFSLGIAIAELAYPELVSGPFPDICRVGDRVVLAHMRAFWRTVSRPGVPQCIELLLAVRAPSARSPTRWSLPRMR